ncbi:MAG: adenosine deaminase, partial [Nitrosopumilus sp.]|nr:adenosine deaminase [Nitrosopumilus sp.]
RRNNIKLKEKSVKELKSLYKFDNLQDFLDIYNVRSKVLIKKRDFYDLTMAYLRKAHQQNVLHAEMFFDPQTHVNRGIKYTTVLNGISSAMRDAEKKWGISSKLIMCFLRDLSADSAMSILKEALKHKKIVAVGLDSAELGYSPSKFKKVFDYAKKSGLLTVAHAGEEGSAEDVRKYLKLLKISRIDHGNRSLDDEKLVKELAERKITLTSCPLSNYKLKVVKKMEKNPVKRMLRKGLKVTVNSDDPAYFGGYINENYQSVYDALNLTKKDIYTLAKNSFEGSFLSDSKKQMMLEKLDRYAEKNE